MNIFQYLNNEVIVSRMFIFFRNVRWSNQNFKSIEKQFKALKIYLYIQINVNLHENWVFFYKYIRLTIIFVQRDQRNHTVINNIRLIKYLLFEFDGYTNIN